MPNQTNGLRRACWAAIGLGYLMWVALWFCQIARTPFWATWMAVLTGAILLTTLLLAWLVRWARREDLHDKQFSLATLLLATALLAIFLALVRWLVVRQPGLPSGDLMFFMIFGLVCLAILASALPGVLLVADAVIWLAVWLVRNRGPRRGAGAGEPRARE
jgi:hypothetical protein